MFSISLPMIDSPKPVTHTLVVTGFLYVWYDIVMSDETISLSSLQPDPNNANKGTERGSEMIEASLTKLGAGRSIVLDKNGMVIAGNKTIAAAEALGMDKVKVVRTDGSELVAVLRTDLDLSNGDGKARQLAYADNRTSQVSMEFDPGIVAADLEMGIDLGDWFEDFELEDIGALLDEPPPEADAEPQISRADELQKEWQVETGQLWRLPSRIGGHEHRLICGDCTDKDVVGRVLGGEKADMVFTDPPYGMNFKGVTFGKSGIENDTTEQSFTVLRDSNKAFPIENGVIAICFGMSRQDRMFLAMAGRTYHRQLVIYKPNGIAHPWRGWIMTSEAIHIFSVGQPVWVEENHCHDVYKFDYSERPDKDIDHPNVKPLSIVSDVIHKSGGHIIYDPFLGSGTTIIAAENLSRQCRAVEISPAYVAVALQRYQDAFGIEPELIT